MGVYLEPAHVRLASMRYLTAGESHGPQLTTILEGFPAQVPIAVEDINPWLEKRQLGYGRGRRMQIEKDAVEFLSGIRAGRSTGAPITLKIENKDHKNWLEIMDVAAGNEPRKKALTAARPGHADLVGGIKYRHKDLRDVLERASARETASRVAVGAMALKLLSELGVQGANYVDRLAGIASGVPFSWDKLSEIEASPVRCLDLQAAQAMIARIDQAKEDGDTLGGVLEVRFRGLVPGLGSYTHWDRKLDGRIAHALMATQAVKGVEIGRGFENADLAGSRVHDAVYYRDPTPTQGHYQRDTNGAGGLEAGMTNGEDLLVRVALKPIATLMKPLPTVDVVTHEAADAARERSDTTAVPAAGVIFQCVVGWVLAEAYCEKFGADTLPEMQARLTDYQSHIASY
jgi:chorismate synthase